MENYAHTLTQTVSFFCLFFITLNSLFVLNNKTINLFCSEQLAVSDALCWIRALRSSCYMKRVKIAGALDRFIKMPLWRKLRPELVCKITYLFCLFVLGICICACVCVCVCQTCQISEGVNRYVHYNGLTLILWTTIQYFVVSQNSRVCSVMLQ